MELTAGLGPEARVMQQGRRRAMHPWTRVFIQERVVIRDHFGRGLAEQACTRPGPP